MCKEFISKLSTYYKLTSFTVYRICSGKFGTFLGKFEPANNFTARVNNLEFVTLIPSSY